MRTIRLTGGAATNLYVISYRDPNPERAKKVVQSLLAIFVESSLGDKRQDSRSALKFIDDQIKRYEETLQASENRLKDFRLKYLGVAGRDGPGLLRRTVASSQRTSTVPSSSCESAQESRDSYKRELAGETATYLPDPGEARARDAVPEVDARIAALRRSSTTCLRKYTDQHPDVVATKRLIEQLEQQRTTELEARQQGVGWYARPVHRRNAIPFSSNCKISLADAEASVASARAKLAGYQSQYAQLKAQARLVPEVEAEYVQLTRDYEVQGRRTIAFLHGARQQGWEWMFRTPGERNSGSSIRRA